LTTAALSTARVLELRLRRPWLDRIFRAGAICGILGAVFALLGMNLLVAPVISVIILLLATAAMVVSSAEFNNTRESEAGLKAAAFALLWIGLILTSLQRLGFYPLPNWMAQSYALTSIVHFILLTGSLAVRLHKAEVATRESDKRLVQTALAAEGRATEIAVERTKELVAAKKLAEDALRAELDSQLRQVRFMEVISHQYRTPLAAIRSNIESVRFTLPQGDEANRERLDWARRGIARLVEVLEVNLDRSRLQGPSFQAHFREVALGDVLNASANRARDLLQDAEIRVELPPQSQASKIFIDPEMVAIAVINLLENGVKFSAPAIRPTVWLSGETTDDGVTITVRDRGIGIPHDEIAQVTATEVRGSNAGHIAGTGMGLSLVSRIAEIHEGNLILTRAPDGGTLAVIFIPSKVASQNIFD
jgi:signal transduction histidine kinase